MERAAGLRPDKSWSRRFSRIFSRDKNSPGDAELPREVSLSLQDRAMQAVDSQRGRSGAYLLAVASGKGGTGKSFLATNLGVALCSRGRRVTLIDCDFGMANDHLLMGVTRPGRSNTSSPGPRTLPMLSRVHRMDPTSCRAGPESAGWET